jgi:hypothetical protein
LTSNENWADTVERTNIDKTETFRRQRRFNYPETWWYMSGVVETCVEEELQDARSVFFMYEVLRTLTRPSTGSRNSLTIEEC